MAKSKTRKSQKQKQMVENEVLVYIYSLVLITLSIIGGLQIGFIGELTTSIIKYVFGNLYGVIYGVIIVLCVMMMLKKSVRDVPMKYLIGIGVLLCAWIIAASIPQNETLKGMDILSRYLQDSMLIFRGEIAAKGGLIGAFLVSLCTFLFDYKGTWIIVIALLILALILLLSGSGFARLKAGAVSLVAPFVSMRKNHAAKGDARRERKQQAKKVKKEQEAEPKEAKSMFGKINIDERVRPGQASFLDVDDDFDIQSDGRSTAFLADKEHALEEESDVLDKQAFKEAENKRIIEDTIGGEDTFVSSFQEDWSKYKLPRLTLLKDAGKKSRSTANVSAANDAGRQLIEILDQFGVKAPIPGKSAVGIEIPNVEKTSVSMKELMKNIPDKLAQSKMLFALGKDLMGNCVYGELNRMPHLLIAGATGSGKSVCVNSIITSILMRARPDEVKLLLVDPKKVEFTPYKEIPHLLGPVITDGDEANRALKVIVTMMDNRYELFSMAGVRNIAGYNAHIEAHPEEGLSPLPWVVVIIDELADLMLVAAKEVEASIQRITQLARAAGIHLIVATQRPSVDVITGIIKANIPSRIAFAVSSAVDSRTILDQMGAEKLLGYGDMLYVPVGETVATRVQGVFVSDDEVADICEFVSRQGKPKFDDAFVRLELLDGGVGPTSSETGDPLYDEVKEFIISTRKASTSLIQRKFSIGYARAARLIDTLEDNGIIGPARGSKPREVYAKSEQAEEE